MLHYLVRFYNWANYDITNDFNRDLPTMMRPLSVLAMLVFYNYFVLSLGPRLMKNRRPFNLKNVMIVYNAIQVFINGFIFYQAFTVGWSGYYSFFCNDLDFRDTPFHRRVAYLCYVYYLIKLSDLLDTVFFVLRKKQSHVSFLHLYHHTGMVMLAYSNAKWLPGGHHTFVGLVNSFVHMFMYLYYLVTLIYPSHKALPWKRFITQLQMFQFALIFTQMGITSLQPACNYPRWILMVILPQNAFMIVLFWDFYKRAYLSPQAKVIKSENGTAKKVQFENGSNLSKQHSSDKISSAKGIKTMKSQ